jgi:hypothetical protein
MQGFGTAAEFNDYLDANRELTASRLTSKSNETVYGKHPLQHHPKDGLVQRIRKWTHRNQAKVILWSFALTELLWFVYILLLLNPRLT